MARMAEAHRNGWSSDPAKHFPERPKLVREGWGSRMESRGTGASEDGWRRSPRTILRRRRPTGWKRTRGEGFWGRQGTELLQEAVKGILCRRGCESKGSVS